MCLGWLCWKQFLKGGHHLLLQNVTVHVGIYVSLNEPQFPSTSSSHAAPDHDATTTMLGCRQGTIFLVLLTMLDTIRVKQVYLRFRPHGFSNSCSWPGRLQPSVCGFVCEPASLEASFWDDGHANQIVAVCGAWSEHLPLLQPLKQGTSIFFETSHRSTVSEFDSFLPKARDLWRPKLHLPKTTWPLQYLLQTKRTSALFPLHYALAWFSFILINILWSN